MSVPKLALEFGLAAAICAIATAETETRTWTSSGGESSVEGKLITVVVQLERTDGRVVNVPIDSLSDGDRKYVAGELGSAGKPPTGPPETERPNEEDPPVVEGESSAERVARVLGEDGKKLLATLTHPEAPRGGFSPDVSQGEFLRNPLLCCRVLEVGKPWKQGSLLEIDRTIAGRSSFTVSSGILNHAVRFYRDSPARGDDYDQYGRWCRWRIQQQCRSAIQKNSEDARAAHKLVGELLADIENPDPAVRVRSLLEISGYQAFADEIVPRAEKAMKDDLSPAVRLAAGASLGGLGPTASSAVCNELARIDDDKSQFVMATVLFVSACQIDPRHPTVERLWKAAMRYDRRPTAEDPYFYARRDFITLPLYCCGEGNIDWAVPSLLAEAGKAKLVHDFQFYVDPVQQLAPNDYGLYRLVSRISKDRNADKELRIYADTLVRQAEAAGVNK